MGNFFEARLTFLTDDIHSSSRGQPRNRLGVRLCLHRRCLAHRPFDRLRTGFSKILPDEKKESAVAFLHAAVVYFQSLGITGALVMTDNGSCYKSFAFRDACKALGLKHIRTRPYTPKTSGKAERFIQTSFREWAYARAYPTSDYRKQALEPWLHNYNWHRPHGSLQSTPPSADWISQ